MFAQIILAHDTTRQGEGSDAAHARGATEGVSRRRFFPCLSSAAAISRRSELDGARWDEDLRGGGMEKLLRSNTGGGSEETLKGEKVPPALFLSCVSLRGLNIGLAKDANENQTAWHDFSLASVCLC